MVKRFLFACICMIAFAVHAAAQSETTDVMRSNGKIYVVMAVAITIVVGLFAYVASIDRKISKLEK